jgi:hypothetical protein
MKLGTEPQDTLTLEIGMTAGSGLLAVHFALVCARHWPCVVLAEEWNAVTVFDREEMLALQREAQSFIHYGM